MKDGYIGSAFFDGSASAFILPSLHARAEASIGCTMSVQEEGGMEDGDVLCSLVSAGGSGTADGVPCSLPDGTSSEAYFPGASPLAASSGSALGPEWINKTTAKAFLQERKHLAGAGTLKVRSITPSVLRAVKPHFIFTRSPFHIVPAAALPAGGARHQH